MMVAPSLPGNVMSWPSMVGSLAGTDRGLRATGDGEATAEAAGDAAGAATGDGDGFATGDGLAAAAADGEATAGAVVGLGGAVGALVAWAAGCGAQPSASSKVAVEAT